MSRTEEGLAFVPTLAMGTERQEHPEGAMMKACAFKSYGLDKLEVMHVPKPVVEKEGEVLVKVHAAALNPIDKIRLSGRMRFILAEPKWPAVLGYDAAGVVESVHESVKHVKVGDQVFVRLKKPSQGSLAEYCVAHENLVATMPSNMTFEQAASLPLAGMTALQALERGGVKEGDRVFITGGAGGVGSLAIQLAKNVFKCSVVATTASAGEKTELVKSLGADIVVDYRNADFEKELSKEEKFDFGFDTTNESHRIPSLLKPGSHCVTVAGTPTINELERRMNKRALLLVRFFLWAGANRAAMKAATHNKVEWSYMFLNPNRDSLNQLKTAVEDDQLRAVIDSVQPMDNFQVSLDRLVSGRSKGKCVVNIIPCE